MTRRLKITVLWLALSALIFLTGCSSGTQKKYEAAEALLAEGKYTEASAGFGELGSFEDAVRLTMYSRAALAGENGDYETARRAFSVLGDYREAPEMIRYYEARETEAAGRGGPGAAETGPDIRLLKQAADLYAALDTFRDAALRGTDCLDTLYTYGRSLLDDAQFSAAHDVFTELDGLSDSRELAVYCEASLLEADGSWLEAADLFSDIPSVLDSAVRADEARDKVYQQALSLSEGEDPESAAMLFSALGSYRDSEARRTDITRQIIRERLKNGDYEGALFQMDQLPDAVTLQRVTSAEQQRFSAFLDDFVRAYLHFSAGTMDAYAGYYEVLPYIRQGGALDSRFRQVLMIGSYSHNSYFNYYGSEVLDVFSLDENCYLAYIRASASASQPVGPVQVTRTFRIVLADTESGLIAGSIEVCLYGVTSTERPVVTGPLPYGELPPDEDGDGIILVDVMKKGYQGTMIIVLDPSRVFAGGPGFYGGNGMLLEDLVRRYDALGGINGGGFIDEDGGGTGGLPEGLTIVDGEAYHWAGSGASAAFDEDNVLHVGFYTKETAAAAGIRDCVSFGPALVIDGVGEYGAYMESGINPRTAIGQREDGAVLLLCIDGRQIHSIGASFGDIRDVMLDFCAVNACSLDGGSSTVMYYNGEYLNSPSSASGTSRYLPNAFLIKK